MALKGGWTTCSIVVALFLMAHVIIDIPSSSWRGGLPLRRCASSSSSSSSSVRSVPPTRRNVLRNGIALGTTVAFLPIIDSSNAICGRNEFWEFNVISISIAAAAEYF
mmetsp:Transcript_18679/g.26304  ORF Transcript_18679/g.26304 Transcript_18679/m.26304 type:complete len:108 (+) Transcript_18679:141-464(+)